MPRPFTYSSSLDSLPEPERHLLDPTIVKLIDKLEQRYYDVLENANPAATLNSHGENVSEDLETLFRQGIKKEKFLDALYRIHPDLPEEDLVNTHTIFLVLKGRAVLKLSLP